MSVVEHAGVVTGVEKGVVVVEMTAVSACAECHAKGHCVSASDTKIKTMRVETPDYNDYSVGQRVLLSVSGRSGAKAVVLCYVVPLVVCLLTLAIFVSCGFGEGASAFISLASVVIYLLILFIFRRRISQKVGIKITHYQYK